MSKRKRRIRKMHRTSRRKALGTRAPRFESLENRHLLSAISLTDDGIVEVQGTENSDNIAAFVEGERFVVEVNGATTSFDNDAVDGLYVEAKGGNDNVKIDATVLQPTLIFGGRGNDRIQGGSGGDVILGGSGDDTIYGRTSGDILLGDGPNSLAEVPVPQPGDPLVAVALNSDAVVDLAPTDLVAPDTDPLALHKYLSRISGINSGTDTIVGGAGDDMIFAGRGNDNVTGDGANQMPGTSSGVTPVSLSTSDPSVAIAQPEILPLGGNDYIEAGAGDDTVNSGAGKDLVFGGSGNDTLNTGLGADIAIGGNGDDTIRADGGRDIVLGDGPNTINQAIITSSGVDPYMVNSALGSGNDYVEAGDGNDTVYAGATSDGGVNLVFGGAGDDNLYGGGGRDSIVGGAGDDTIRSGASADIVLGDSANSLADLPVPVPGEPHVVNLATAVPLVTDIAPVDPTQPDPLALHKYLSRVAGINSGSDNIVAGTGNDLVFSGADNDNVQGDGANVYPTPTPVVKTAALAPVIVAPQGNDYIESGSGNDRVNAGFGANIVLGGTGHDTLTSGAGDDIVVGGSGNDVIRTGSGADRVLGDGPATINQVLTSPGEVYLANSELGGGHDYIESGAGDDKVWAGRGRDVVFAGAGDDFAHGGRGNDLLVGGSGADTLIGSGGDDVIISGGPNFGPSVTPASVLASRLANDAAFSGDQSNDYVEAGDGNDVVLSFGGHDLVFGGAGDDTLLSGAGNDILVGGNGNDFISAGAGHDAVLGDGPDSLADAIVPMPTVDAVGGASWAWYWALATNSQLGRGHDVIDGGAGNDWMFGGAGNDLLFGRTGNDLLHGGQGDDELHDDLNSGGDGADIFIGDSGADKVFANDGPGGPVDWVFYDAEDELHVDGEDWLIFVG